MIGFIVAMAFLTVTGAVGVAALARARLGLTPLEMIAYGVPLGGVGSTLVLLILAILFGLTAPVVIVLALGCATTSLALWPERGHWAGRLTTVLADRRWHPVAGSNLGLTAQSSRGEVTGRWSDLWPRVRFQPGWLPTLILIALGIRWVLYFRSALTFDDGALWAGHEFIWSDWSAHIGDVAGFAYGDNFPPENLRVQGKPYAYHFLAALTSAALVPLGLTLASALSIMSGVYSLFLGLGIYAFARRLIGNHGAAVLAVILFLFGGSLGWLLTAQRINQTHDVWQVLVSGDPWRYGELVESQFVANIPYIFRLASERGYLFGLPLTLLVLTLLLIGTASQRNRAFLAAGVVAGLLPLAHLSSLLALALITPFLFALFPSRHWLLALPVVGALAIPQTLWLVGTDGGAGGALRVQVGWIAAPDPWWWFWLKNLGLFLPLVLFALIDRTILSPRSRRALWAFMPIFPLANLLVFQPWDGDNTKVLLYWFLATAILVAALLAQAWRHYRTLVVRTLVAGAVASMTLTGAIGSLDQLLGMDRFRLLSSEEIEVAETLRRLTPSHAVFVTATQSTQPVAMLAGRPIVLGFPGWAWAYGIDSPELEADVEAILRFDPTAPALLAAHDVSYVFIGPIERERFAANEAAFQARYPVVVQTEQFNVYAITPEATKAVEDARAAGAAP